MVAIKENPHQIDVDSSFLLLDRSFCRTRYAISQKKKDDVRIRSTKIFNTPHKEDNRSVFTPKESTGLRDGAFLSLLHVSIRRGKNDFFTSVQHLQFS